MARDDRSKNPPVVERIDLGAIARLSYRTRIFDIIEYMYMYTYLHSTSIRTSAVDTTFSKITTEWFDVFRKYVPPRRSTMEKAVQSERAFISSETIQPCKLQRLSLPLTLKRILAGVNPPAMQSS